MRAKTIHSEDRDGSNGREFQSLYRVVEQLAARQAHYLKVGGSSPPLATHHIVPGKIVVQKRGGKTASPSCYISMA